MWRGMRIFGNWPSFCFMSAGERWRGWEKRRLGIRGIGESGNGRWRMGEWENGRTGEQANRRTGEQANRQKGNGRIGDPDAPLFTLSPFLRFSISAFQPFSKAGHSSHRFPQSSDCGPIEAGVPYPVTTRTSAFPQSSDCGPPFAIGSQPLPRFVEEIKCDLASDGIGDEFRRRFSGEFRPARNIGAEIVRYFERDGMTSFY